MAWSTNALRLYHDLDLFISKKFAYNKLKNICMFILYS